MRFRLMDAGAEAAQSYQIRVLPGEQVAERVGSQREGLILTNKRLIHYYKDSSTSRATVAFLPDIVSVRVRRARPNKVYLGVGIGLAFIAFIWSIVTGFGNAFNGLTSSVILISVLVLVLASLALYLTTSGTTVMFRTINDQIAFRLGAGDSMYRFINRWLELKDSLSSTPGNTQPPPMQM